MADVQPGNQPGHLLQAVVILLTIGGGAITSYLSLRSDLQQVRADLTVRVSEHEVRLATIEHSQAKISAERGATRIPGDVRLVISRVSDLLSDVRIQLGRRELPHN